MTLYVSNPSKQDVVFHYRTNITKDTSGPFAIPIASGTQVLLGIDWTREQKNYVIKQILSQGGADAAEAHGRMGKFTGLLYRDNAPVSVEEIHTAHDEVVKDAEDRSVKAATRSALAFDRKANERGKGQRLARVTEVEVIEENAPHIRKTGDEVSFKMTIDPEGRTDIKLPV